MTVVTTGKRSTSSKDSRRLQPPIDIRRVSGCRAQKAGKEKYPTSLCLYFHPFPPFARSVFARCSTSSSCHLLATAGSSASAYLGPCGKRRSLESGRRYLSDL